MEVVTGTLDGRTGTFALQHSGTMNRSVRIKILEKKHFHEFEYSFAE